MKNSSPFPKQLMKKLAVNSLCVNQGNHTASFGRWGQTEYFLMGKLTSHGGTLVGTLVTEQSIDEKKEQGDTWGCGQG